MYIHMYEIPKNDVDSRQSDKLWKYLIPRKLQETLQNQHKYAQF